MGPRFGDIVDEISSNGDLGSCIAELSKRGVEEAILLIKGFDCSVCVGLFGLVGHIGVGDFRNGRAVGKSAVLGQMVHGHSQEENHGKEEGEASNG